MITTCKCGCVHFYRSYLARGIWTQTVESTTHKLVVLDSSTEDLHFTREPKFMRCCDCNRRVLNPDFK